MEYLIPAFYTSLQIMVLIGLGFAVRRLNLIPESFHKAVSGFLVNVALPLYFFTKLGKTDLAFFRDGLFMPAASLVILALSLGMASLVFRFLPLSLGEKRAGMAMASFGNSGYLPLSFVEILPLTMPGIAERFGLDQAPLFIGAYLFANSPLLWTVGNFLITRSGTAIKPRELLTPPLYGIIAGLLIPLFHLEPFVFDPKLPFVYIFSALQQLGLVITPMILVNLGAMIAGVRLRDHFRKEMGAMLAGVSFIRFLLLPLLFYISYFLFLRHMNLHPAIVFILFLETHVPPANNLSVMAIQAGVNEDVSAFTLLGTHIVYILLVPLFIALFLHVAV